MPESLRQFKADLFRCLASPVRLHILEELRVAGALTVTELHQRVAAGPANVSQHLGILRAHGLVATRRDGNSIWYRVVDGAAVYALLDTARELFTRQVDSQQRLLEDEPESSRPPESTTRS